MSLKQVFIDTQNKLTSIQVKNLVTLPKPSNNFLKTNSNANQYFKYINIWNDQIDELIKGNKGYAIKDQSVFIEFIPGDCKMLLGNISTYPDSVMSFHLYSISLNDGENMDRNIAIFDLRDRLKSKIAGWSPSGCSMLMCCNDKLDYKHGNVTKYLLSYNFNFQDTKGSIIDNESDIYLFQKSFKNASLSISIFSGWVSGINYYANTSVVVNSLNVYLCAIDNSDIIFDESNWILIPAWVSLKQYVVGNYVYYYNSIYQCLINNADIKFTSSNWNKITH